MVYVYPTGQIRRAAIPDLLNLRVRVYPGVSSLDGLFIDLQLDPATQGLQMYEATDLILCDRPLQTDVPCFIWQVSAVESALFSSARSKRERFLRLEGHLLKFYRPNHTAYAVTTSTYPLVPFRMKEIQLANFATDFAALPYGDMLYIPPQDAPRAIANQTWLRQLTSVDHLREITAAAAAPSVPKR
jgi:hypothetical protein